jgi:hypothetical protein
MLVILARLAVLVSLFGVACPGYALDADPEGYTQAVDAGVSEFGEKNFLEARAHFTRAHRLLPSARTLRALGMVEFELKNYAISVRYLSEALLSDERVLEGERRLETQKLLERASVYTARIHLDVEPHTKVLVDGSQVDLSSNSELVLDVGKHVLEFRADGHIPQKDPWEVHGGERETMRIRLVPIQAAPLKRTPMPATRTERRLFKNPWIWTAVGVVVVGAATGTAVALSRDTGRTKLEDPYTGTLGSRVLVGPTR